MKTICILKSGYDCESPKEVLQCSYTMTVGDVRRLLSWYDDEVPVVVKGKENTVYPFFALDEIVEDCAD